MTVFHKGKPQASKVSTPTGGQTKPAPMAGDKLQ